VVAIEHVTVVPMDSEHVLPDYTVVVTGTRIAAMGPSLRVAVPRRATRVDGRGRYLMAHRVAHLLRDRGEHVVRIERADGCLDDANSSRSIDPWAGGLRQRGGEEEQQAHERSLRVPGKARCCAGRRLERIFTRRNLEMFLFADEIGFLDPPAEVIVDVARLADAKDV
jgi:hypothetical protein